MKGDNIIETEIWKDIKGWEGLYQVSNLGRVKTVAKTVWNSRGFWINLKENIRVLHTNNCGYQAIDLTRAKNSINN